MGRRRSLRGWLCIPCLVSSAASGTGDRFLSPVFFQRTCPARQTRYPEQTVHVDHNPHRRTRYDWKHVVRGFALLVLVYVVVVYAIPKPAAVKPEGWRMTGLYAATITGQMVEPIPGGAVVLLGVVLASLNWRAEHRSGWCWPPFSSPAPC